MHFFLFAFYFILLENIIIDSCARTYPVYHFNHEEMENSVLCTSIDAPQLIDFLPQDNYLGLCRENRSANRVAEE